MVDFHTAATTASVAAASSLLTLAAAVYLLPRVWSNNSQQRDSQTPNDPSGQRRSGASTTPEPGPHNPAAAQQGGLFSPVNRQKRPDPYDPSPRKTYLCWDDYFMALAFLSAERSKDPNKQVGACIVNDDNIILSIGYNGFPRGCADSALPWSKRAKSGSILDTKYPYVVHAEANALLNKNQAHVTGARIYVTLFPCNECAKLLIQAGIKEVIYHEAKLEPTGKRPGTMERAAEADAAADRLEEQEQEQEAAAAARAAGADQGAGSSGGVCAHAGPSDCAMQHRCPAECAAVAHPAGTSASEQQALVQQQQQRTVAGRSQGAPPKFGVGASDDVDASYAASQKLLMLAGVKLRQHTLQRSIHLGVA